MDTSLIHNYPQMIEAALMQLADVSDQLSDTRDVIKDAELEAFVAAADARTEDGKVVYTNDKAREFAARKSLKANDTYQEAKSIERRLEREKLTLEATAERLRREYRISLLDYEARMLGHRAA